MNETIIAVGSSKCPAFGFAETRMVDRAAVWFLAGLALLASLSVTAAPPQRITPLPAPQEAATDLRLVIADADGGYGVYLHDGRVLMFDGNDVLVGQRVSPLLDSGRFPVRFEGFSANGNHVILRGDLGNPVRDRRQEIGTLPECSVDRLAEGKSLTVFHFDRIADSGIFARALDGEGGMWMVDAVGQVFRYGADCEKEMMARILGDVVGLSTDPVRPWAYAHTADGRVFSVGRFGIRWQRRLPAFDGITNHVVVPMGPIGGGLHVTPYMSSVFGFRLAAHDRAGNLVWIWDDPEGDGLIHVQAHLDGVLVVTTNYVRMIGTDGLVRWTQNQSNEFIRSIPSPHASRHAWLLVRSFTEHGRQEILAFDLQQGEIARWEVGEDVLPVAGRVDGSLLAMRGEGIEVFGALGETLLHGRLDGRLVEADLPLVAADSKLVAHLTDETGSLAVTLARDSWTLHGLDTDLRFSWQQGQRTEIVGTASEFQLAANGEVACVLVERWIEARRSIGLEVRCFDRRTGRPLFSPVEWDGFRGFLNPRIGAHVEVVHAGPFETDLIRRRWIALDGRVIETAGRLPQRLFASLYSFANMVFADDEQVALVTFPSGSQATIFLFDSLDAPGGSGTVIESPSDWTSSVGNSDSGFPNLALGHGQLAMLGTAQFSSYPWPIQTHLLRAHAADNGRQLWEREVASPASHAFRALFQTDAGWLLAQVSTTEVRLNHFAAADGAVILERVL
ncbi:MAG: hypothetical protein ACNA7J_13030, partial [Wenzhouxiangella sp.]